MKASFDYMPIETDEGTTYRPVIPVKVEYRGVSRVIYFLLDSGADFSVLTFEAAKSMGMEFDSGNKRKAKGVLQHSVDCVQNKVKLSILPFWPDSFESSLYASRELKPIHNLLGRDFFEKFTICFFQKSRKLCLEKNR